MLDPTAPRFGLDPTVIPRPLVAWFAQQIEIALRRNDHKPAAAVDESESKLIESLLEEVRELARAIESPYSGFGHVITEAADVAAFALFLAVRAQLALASPVHHVPPPRLDPYREAVQDVLRAARHWLYHRPNLGSAIGDLRRALTEIERLEQP